MSSCMDTCKLSCYVHSSKHKCNTCNQIQTANISQPSSDYTTKDLLTRGLSEWAKPQLGHAPRLQLYELFSVLLSHRLRKLE